MSKRDKIIYWIATLWLSLGMASTGIVQILQPAEQMAEMVKLGIPLYFLTIIGVWKILGVVAILVPKFPLVKEWAYAGFFFVATGALFTHLFIGDEPSELFGPTLLTVLVVVSWYFRPAEKKLVN